MNKPLIIHALEQLLEFVEGQFPWIEEKMEGVECNPADSWCSDECKNWGCLYYKVKSARNAIAQMKE